MRVSLLTVFFGYILLTHSCINDKVDDNTGPCDSSYFVSTIKPIFLTTCYDPDNDGGCHNEAAAGVRGNFSVYNAAQNGIQSRLAKIKDYINRDTTDEDFMPRGRRLTPEQFTALNAWLDAGGNKCQ